MTYTDSSSPERTVRELGGEIWAQLRDVGVVDWQAAQLVTDEVMGVLARHIGTTITNDSDLPVERSEPRFSEGG